MYAVFKCIIYEGIMKTICICAFYLQVFMMTILWHGCPQNLGGWPSRGGMWEGWIVLYIYIYSVGCWVAMETRRNPWVMGVSSGSDEPAYPTPSLSTPPHSFHPHPPVTPTLAQVNSFNIEYKSGISDIYTCCAAVRHATSVCSPYIDGISKAGIRTYSRRIIKHPEAWSACHWSGMVEFVSCPCS